MRSPFRKLMVGIKFLVSYLGYTSPHLNCLHLDLTDRCNLNCSMCDWKLRVSRKTDIDFETYCTLVLEANSLGLRSLLLGAAGEPLLYPHLEEAIDFARENGIRTTLVSSLSLPLSKERVNALLKLDQILISVDAVTEGTYKKIRIGGDFNTVLQNISLLTNAEGNNTGIVVSFVVQKKNYQEVGNAVDFFASRGVDQVNLGLINIKSPILKHENLNASEFDVFIDQARTAKRKLSEYGMKSCRSLNESLLTENRENILRGIRPISLSIAKIPCWWLWFGCYVSADALVYPCCSLCGRKEFVQGDLRKDGISKIWALKSYDLLRRRFMNYKCEDCVYCESEFNVDFHDRIGWILPR